MGMWPRERAPYLTDNADMTDNPGKRRDVTVRRFTSPSEADRHDLEYWQRIPDAERILEVWRLSRELWQLRGEWNDEPGLCRSVASDRRR